MIDILSDTPAHLIAIRASGHIEDEDIDRVADRIDEALTAQEQVNFYVEAASLEGFASGAFLKGILYDLSQIKNLRRVHRAALVADEGWIRRVAEWEDRLLPGIELRIFDPAEREEALEWAAETPPEAGAPKRGLEEIPTTDAGVVAFAVTGPITGADVEAITPKLSAAYDQHGSANLLMRMGGSYKFRLDVFSGQLAEMKTDALENIERYAAVGAPEWMQSAAGLIAPLMKAEIRFFDTENEAAAWDWIGARPAETSAEGAS